MKSKNVANWLKTNLERMASNLDINEIEDFIARLDKIKKSLVKKSKTEELLMKERLKQRVDKNG